MTWLMLIVCGALDMPSMHDNLYLKSVRFDVDESGACEIETTPNPDEAYQFKSTSAVLDTWNTQSKVHPLRHDNKPNKPLTAWTIEVINRSGAPRIKRQIFYS